MAVPMPGALSGESDDSQGDRLRATVFAGKLAPIAGRQGVWRMIRGSCQCGGIRFEIDAVVAITHCHCSICRKLSGGAFASYAHVAADKFRFLAGEELIASYESTPGSHRNFCRVCGSPAPGKASYLKTVSIPAGLLDDDPGVRPVLHTFVGSKAPWVEITDELRQFEKWVPGYEPKGK
jgi:hypothetical protein